MDEILLTLFIAFIIGSLVPLISRVFEDKWDKAQPKALKSFDEAIRFVGYCEKHKNELPENIRDRLDELQEALAN